ncbi:MAG: aspartate kinase [Candidatus Levybacteria bacterium RIFCSPLOWO2_01_FULL_37_26]|nr:MAG: aspartate kinase [Candidatus Levybacteria bacterium RIFCSPLOWO2_01_FULL_37_26]
MTSNRYKETIVIKLGGSLIVPNGGLDIPYIKKFYTFIRQQVAEKNRRFFILIGGGKLSRHYRDAGAEITGHELLTEDLDWLGIHATRLNAHLFRTIFRDLAHPYIIKKYEFVQKPSKPIVLAAGWKPGWSTDYDAVILAQDYNVKTIIKMSNTDYVYDKDPNKFKDAKPLPKISWKDYRSMVGDTWKPGQHEPFDPIATKLASDLGLRVFYVDGRDIANVEKAIDGKKFVGTIIE